MVRLGDPFSPESSMADWSDACGYGVPYQRNDRGGGHQVPEILSLFYKKCTIIEAIGGDPYWMEHLPRLYIPHKGESLPLSAPWVQGVRLLPTPLSHLQTLHPMPCPWGVLGTKGDALGARDSCAAGTVPCTKQRTKGQTLQRHSLCGSVEGPDHRGLS